MLQVRPKFIGRQKEIEQISRIIRAIRDKTYLDTLDGNQSEDEEDMIGTRSLRKA